MPRSVAPLGAECDPLAREALKPQIIYCTTCVCVRVCETLGIRGFPLKFWVFCAGAWSQRAAVEVSILFLVGDQAGYIAVWSTKLAM